MPSDMAHDGAYPDVPGCPRVQAGQLPLLTRVGLRAFGEAGPLKYGVNRCTYYRRLHDINRNIFRFVLLDPDRGAEEANVGGFIGVIPTRRGVYDAFIRGELSQFEFGDGEILPHDYAGPCDVYVQALYLDRHEHGLVRRLLWGAMRALLELSDGALRTDGRVRIYAEGVMNDGRRLMEEFGMRVCGRSKDRNPTYAIHKPARFFDTYRGANAGPAAPP